MYPCRTLKNSNELVFREMTDNSDTFTSVFAQDLKTTSSFLISLHKGKTASAAGIVFDIKPCFTSK